MLRSVCFVEAWNYVLTCKRCQCSVSFKVLLCRSGIFGTELRGDLLKQSVDLIPFNHICDI